MGLQVNWEEKSSSLELQRHLKNYRLTLCDFNSIYKVKSEVKPNY